MERYNRQAMDNSNNVITLSLSVEDARKAESFYEGEMVENANPYVAWAAKHDGTSIVCFSKVHKDGTQKVVFQGENPIKEATIFGAKEEKKVEERPFIKREKTSPYHFAPQIGSDEVGTGDLFGPVCVVAAYLDLKDYILAQELGITDSKKMKDDYILEIGPRLVKEFAYSSLSLDNETYNKVHNAGTNMNAIKAKMHNKALLNLKKRYPLARVYQDQFAEPKLYYSYLKHEDEVLDDITFSTKGELAFPSVALASVLARYSFLRKMQELSKKYKMEFPFGSGKDADEFIAKFVEKYGKEELKKVAKLNFKNFKDLA